jgi:hypothetical protein
MGWSAGHPLRASRKSWDSIWSQAQGLSSDLGTDLWYRYWAGYFSFLVCIGQLDEIRDRTSGNARNGGDNVNA